MGRKTKYRYAWYRERIERYWVVVAEGNYPDSIIGVAVVDVATHRITIEQLCKRQGLTVARIIDHYRLKKALSLLRWSIAFPYRWGEMGSIDDELFGFFGSIKPNRARLRALDEKILTLNQKRNLCL